MRIKNNYERPKILVKEMQGVKTLSTSPSGNDGTIDSIVENDYNWEIEL